MLQALMSLVLVFFAAGPPAELFKGPAPEKSRPTALLAERIDPKTPRTLTGRVDKVEFQDEGKGALRMRSSIVPGSKVYVFRIDGRTKLLDAAGAPLKEGLKNERLKGAEVRVEFQDGKPGGEKADGAGTQYARLVQLIRAGK